MGLVHGQHQLAAVHAGLGQAQHDGAPEPPPGARPPQLEAAEAIDADTVDRGVGIVVVRGDAVLELRPRAHLKVEIYIKKGIYIQYQALFIFKRCGTRPGRL